ncbi:MAG: hypothetical protein ACKVRN_02955 [Pyrinomonadaceae bacterium]
MEGETVIICQWKHCEKTAAKHVVFGSRVFASPNEIHSSDAPTAPEHLDLCPQHTDLISRQYVHVSKYELGSCPIHPQNLKAAPKGFGS